jgi:hypothetical protein
MSANFKAGDVVICDGYTGTVSNPNHNGYVSVLFDHLTGPVDMDPSYLLFLCPADEKTCAIKCECGCGNDWPKDKHSDYCPVYTKE